jgi:cytochrome oxidase assembly protein ShyY1
MVALFIGVVMSLRFTPQWKFTALFLLLLPVMMSLGFWQLERAEQKRRMAADFEQRQYAAPVAVENWIDSLQGDYVRVSLRGEFLADKIIFLDNQIRNTAFGFDVIQPFRLASGKGLVLVNRGWIAADSSRRKLPVITPVEGEVTLTGYIHQPSLNRMIDGVIAEIRWPLLIQQVELPRLQALFQQPLAPFVVRLEGAQPAALANDWPIVNVQPEKHTAYAVQWFAMSLTLLLLLIVVNSNIVAWLKRPSSSRSE